MKVLVTGADGFIGSHLVERLIMEGFEVRALAAYNSFNSWGWLDQLSEDVRSETEVVVGDIRDPDGVRTIMSGCELVMHLAALIAIPYSYRAPHSYLETNVKGTLNVLQAAKDLNVGRVVHTSTSEVYGTARYVPIDEEHPLQGQSPYSATKIAADQMALAYHRSFGTPVSVIRPFNTYGPRQSSRAVIPTVITQVLAGNERVKLGALNPTRDFTFVSDTVKGFLAIAKSELAVGEVINVCSGFEISVAETTRLIGELMGVEISVLADEQRLRPERSEVERLFGDKSKAQRLTGWSPEYTSRDGFARGLRKTIDWFSSEQGRTVSKVDTFTI